MALLYTAIFHARRFLAHSNKLMQWRGVRRLSVRPSVNFCANRFFSQANGWIATKLAHDGPQKSLHPASRMCSNSRSTVKVKGHAAHLEFHKKKSITQSFSTSPSLCQFGFLPHPNPQMAVRLRCD